MSAAVSMRPAPAIFEDPELRAYVLNEPAALPSPPVFADRRWTIGGIVSLTPAPPPVGTRRSSLGAGARCPAELVSAPSSRWRQRRYSLGPDSSKHAAGRTKGSMIDEGENTDPQLRFVSTRRGGGLAARVAASRESAASKSSVTPKTEQNPRERRRTRRSASGTTPTDAITPAGEAPVAAYELPEGATPHVSSRRASCSNLEPQPPAVPRSFVAERRRSGGRRQPAPSSLPPTPPPPPAEWLRHDGLPEEGTPSDVVAVVARPEEPADVSHGSNADAMEEAARGVEAEPTAAITPAAQQRASSCADKEGQGDAGEEGTSPVSVIAPVLDVSDAIAAAQAAEDGGAPAPASAPEITPVRARKRSAARGRRVSDHYLAHSTPLAAVPEEVAGHEEVDEVEGSSEEDVALQAPAPPMESEPTPSEREKRARAAEARKQRQLRQQQQQQVEAATDEESETMTAHKVVSEAVCVAASMTAAVGEGHEWPQSDWAQEVQAGLNDAERGPLEVLRRRRRNSPRGAPSDGGFPSTTSTLLQRRRDGVHGGDDLQVALPPPSPEDEVPLEGDFEQVQQEVEGEQGEEEEEVELLKTFAEPPALAPHPLLTDDEAYDAEPTFLREDDCIPRAPRASSAIDPTLQFAPAPAPQTVVEDPTLQYAPAPAPQTTRSASAPPTPARLRPPSPQRPSRQSMLQLRADLIQMQEPGDQLQCTAPAPSLAPLRSTTPQMPRPPVAAAVPEGALSAGSQPALAAAPEPESEPIDSVPPLLPEHDTAQAAPSADEVIGPAQVIDLQGAPACDAPSEVIAAPFEVAPTKALQHSSAGWVTRRHPSPAAAEHGSSALCPPPVPASAPVKPKPPEGAGPALSGPRTLRRSTGQLRLYTAPRPHQEAGRAQPRRASYPHLPVSGAPSGAAPSTSASSGNLPVLSPRVSPRGVSPPPHREHVGAPAGSLATCNAWGSHAQLTDRQGLYDLNGNPMQATAAGVISIPCDEGSDSAPQRDELSSTSLSTRARAINDARAEIQANL